MTTKTIPHNSSVGVYYGPAASNYTIVNNFTILNPTSDAGSRYGDNAVDLNESNNLTLLNSGIINSRYSAAGGSSGAGVFFTGQQVSITNTSAGIIEDTGGFGYGVDIAGGTVVNFGLISGGVGPKYYGFGINIGAGGGFISNASTGTITNGGITGRALTTIVNAGKIQGFTASNTYGAIHLYEGGIVTNLSTGIITSENGAYGVKIGGAAGTVINAGYIDGGSKGGDAVSLTATYGGVVIVDPGAKFHGLVDGGSAAKSTLELGSGAAKGTLTGFNSQYVNFGTLAFAPSAQWLFETNPANVPGVVDGFVQGDTIDITGFTATSISTLTGNKGIVLTNSGGTHVTVNFDAPISNFEFNTGTFGTDLTTICFCTDTQIGTPTGEVPVQTLKPGDIVLTAHNGPRAVAWVGTGKVLATRGKRGIATPVIVRQGALADNLPHRDLHVTKAHSLYIDNVLIPVEFLVNHKTILWDDRAQEVEIYHIELESHDLLIANGVPAESYRDDGNRWLFQNANEGWHLPPQEPYAPVLTGGPIVDAAWQRFLDRAGPRDTTRLTDDPDLHIIIDGQRIDAREHRDGVYIFSLPSTPGSVFVASRAGVPSELGTARDPRSLGVALRQVTIQQGAKFMLFDADDERLTAGFHDYEPSDNLRWTNGYAELPAEAFARFDQGAVVTLHLGGATQYPDERDHAEQVAA